MCYHDVMNSTSDEPALYGTSATGSYRLTGTDWCVIENGIVRYTQAGLRHYTDLFRRHGLALPLPSDEASYKAALWSVADKLGADLVCETIRDLPQMARAEAAVAKCWLERDTAGMAEHAAALTSAASEQASLTCRGANIESLALARITRKGSASSA